MLYLIVICMTYVYNKFKLTAGFDFDESYESKLDFSRPASEKVAALLALQVLSLDEVSMLDA